MEYKEYELDELLPYEQPQAYIVESTDYSDSYKTPVLTAGKSFILGYTNETDGIFDELPVIIFDDFTTATQFVNFKFKVKSSAMKILHINTDLVVPRYIYYRLQTIHVDHSTHKRYWIQQFSKIKVRIPPIPVQQRIVSHIEELFSSLDNAVETLQKTKEQLAVYRQAVLETCIGKGEAKTILECVENMGQGWSPKCIRTPVLNDEEWAVITTTAVQPMQFLYEENKKLPETLEARPKHELNVGDILITRAGPRSRCGICCMVKKTKKKLMNCDKVYRLIVKKEFILPEYFEAVLNSPAFQKEIAFCKTGGNDSGVNLTQDRFLNIKIPVPGISTQMKILSDIASRVSVCDSIEQTVNTALAQAEAMRQSILKEAFEGRL